MGSPVSGSRITPWLASTGLPFSGTDASAAAALPSPLAAGQAGNIGQQALNADLYLAEAQPAPGIDESLGDFLPATTLVDEGAAGTGAVCYVYLAAGHWNQLRVDP